MEDKVEELSQNMIEKTRKVEDQSKTSNICSMSIPETGNREKEGEEMINRIIQGNAPLLQDLTFQTERACCPAQ